MLKRILVCASVFVLALAITGTVHADPKTTTVRLTQGNDVYYAPHGGHYLIRALAGDDVVHAGTGPDIVRGGPGNDRLWTGKGGPGDQVFGGPGNDRIHNWGSGESPGLLVGGPGHDVCVGDPHDTFRGCEVIKFR
jgi:Ca2+-binding RTX toxin-like protein